MNKSDSTTRRNFLGTAARSVIMLGVIPSRVLAAVATDFTHPEPRTDVDGSQVLSGDAVMPHVSELFDEVRKIPHIADGIGCHCGCGVMPDMRSLLSCYEGMGMSQYCIICEGEGRMAVAMSKEGKSLDEIRTAIDRRFG